MSHSLATPLSLAFAVALAVPVAAQAVTITPDQVLRIHFTVPSPPSPTPDVLSLGLGLTTVGAAHTMRTARLYDCGTLMGTATETSFGTYTGALSLGVANGWRQAGSVYTFGNPADVLDFSPLQNATIQGIIEFEIATGSVTFDLANVSLRLIRATSASGGSVSSPQPVITEKLLGPRLVGPVPGTAGAVNTWTTLSGTPGNLMLHGFSLACGPILVPVVPPVYYDIGSPVASVLAVIGSSGQSTVSFLVPGYAAGVTLFAQSVELIGPDIKVSNFVVNTF
ncbi:MAG: hypothetical protein KDC98_14510 [Planctomycetes bacterium]|nr:hypothetical protein [Planctomycetota bacterium]